jgi:hypothetical protein
MNKKVSIITKLLAIVLFITLIINVNIYNRNTYIEYNPHNYKCIMNMYNEDLKISYDYAFNVLTDNEGHIQSDEYYEEFKYEIQDYYNQSKKFYENFEDDLSRIYDDEHMIIKSIKTYDLSNAYDNYESFKNSIENQQFKCEEIL